MAIINQHSHRSLNTSLPAFTFQYSLKENKQHYKADASNKPKHSIEDAIIAIDRPEAETSLENGGKTINNVELKHEKALNNIDNHKRVYHFNLRKRVRLIEKKVKDWKNKRRG